MRFAVAHRLRSELRRRLPRRSVRAAAAPLALGACLLLLLPAGASARKFARSIEGPFGEPAGVAVSSSGDVWVGDLLGFRKNEASKAYELSPFATGNAFVKEVPLAGNMTAPQSLAIEGLTGRLYVTGGSYHHEGITYGGGFVEPFEEDGSPFTEWLNEHVFGGEAHVAFDGSTDSLYVSHSSADPAEPTGDGLRQGIERLDPTTGAPAAFACEASHSCPAYVEANQITGVPGESFTSYGGGEGGGGGAPTDISVDGGGDLFVVDPGYNAEEPKKPEGAVVEFNPEGGFVQACTGEEEPGIGGYKLNGWGAGGAALKAVAVDPNSGNILVAVASNAIGKGVIDEFSPSCKYTGHQITESAPGVPLTRALQGMAFDANGDLYVVEEEPSTSRKAVLVYEGEAFLPPEAKVALASERTPATAVLNGSAMVPKGETPAECYFEYVSEAAYEPAAEDPFQAGQTAQCVPAAAAIPADEAFHPVHAEVAGLTPGATYRYRLVVKANGAPVASGSLAFTVPGAPRIDASSVGDVSTAFATLNATISPLGAATVYRFEYDTRPYAEGEGGHGVSVPVPDMEIGAGGQSGNAQVSVREHIEGLTPGVTYYYRVVAANEVGSVSGAICEGRARPDCSFTALAPAVEGLPDERAYELLTPPNKGSAEDMFDYGSLEGFQYETKDAGYPSDSGDEFILGTRAAFGSFAASGENMYVFRRGSSGWRTLPLASPSLGAQTLKSVVFDPAAGFSTVGVADQAGSAASPQLTTVMALVGAPGGPYTKMLSEPGASGQGRHVDVVGASHDLTHIVMDATAPDLLPPQQTGGGTALYEWGAGSLALVSVEPGGAPFKCGAVLGQGSIPGTAHNAVSADGSRIFFTAPDPYVGNPQGSGCWNEKTGENAPQLYVRTGGQTLQVSAPEAGVLENGQAPVEHEAIYVGASEDGSKVFFITQTELTGEAVTLKLHDPELYECEIVTENAQARCNLTRISRGEAGGRNGEVMFVPAISPQGNAVYFVSLSQLAAGAPPASEGGDEASADIYRYDTESGTVKYVAGIEWHRDYPQNNEGGWWRLYEKLGGVKGVALDTRANWYTSPDGRYLLFATKRDVTGYDTVEAPAASEECEGFDTQDPGNVHRCTEVYRYDSSLPVSHGEPGRPENPACLSCDPSGARPVSNAFFATGAAPQVAPAGGPVRAMSDNGLCAFFQTADGLVSQDANGAYDVYEWEAPGAGRCEAHPPAGVAVCAQARGCLRLITGGVDSHASFFLGASPSGHDVFFGTHAKLVPQDTDSAGDLYDARIGGGFPTPAGVGPCEGDACATPPAAPVDPTPGSLTFFGPGNMVASSGASAMPKALTNAQKLARALRACRKKRKRKRRRCEATARKRYRKSAKHTTRARHATRTGRAGR